MRRGAVAAPARLGLAVLPVTASVPAAERVRPRWVAHA
jgi:hypothetical protein